MDFKQIQELIKTVNKSSISELSIQDGEFQITIKQGTENMEGAAQAQQMAMHMMMPMHQMQMPQMGQSMQQGHAPLAIPAPPTPSSPADAGGTGAAGSSAGTTIKSPMIGTFYRSSSPDKPAFVNVGDEVKKGQVLCIIEAMKLFNEIESEVSGRIIKVLADDASPVEYDQPLFLVEPA